MRHHLLAFVLVFAPVATLASDGIFADFTTSMGAFTVELDAVEAPRTVANFVSLAEGTRPWVDSLTGAVKVGTPYYDGVIYHRVIAGFMSQTGSRNGQGTDGPGYRFRDEISPNLLHVRHVISMANSGPNTNGAQFFITDQASPHLDGLHAVFGRVVAGGDVVDAINAVPTDAGERPLTPVVIESISIRRVGEDAQAFDVMASDLPVVSALPGQLDVTAGGPIRYHIEPAANRTVTQAHRSFDLASWSPVFSRNEDRSDVDQSILNFGTATAPRAFFNISQVYYPDALPASMAERVLDVEFGGNQRLVFSVNADGQTGTCDYTLNSDTNNSPITEVYVYPQDIKAEYIFVTGFGNIAIIASVREFAQDEYSGVADVYQFNQTEGWIKISSGTFTLTK